MPHAPELDQKALGRDRAPAVFWKLGVGDFALNVVLKNAGAAVNLELGNRFGVGMVIQMDGMIECVVRAATTGFAKHLP